MKPAITSRSDFRLSGAVSAWESSILEINTAWANEQAKALAVRGLTVLGVVTLAFGMAALWLDRRLVRAVRALTAAIHALRRGQLDEEIRVGTGDELDELGESVNRMARSLRESEARVKHWQGRLEQTIAHRTQELEESQMLLAHREKMRPRV